MRRENFREQVEIRGNLSHTFKPLEHAVVTEMWEVSVENNSSATCTVKISVKDPSSGITDQVGTKTLGAAASGTDTHEYDTFFSRRDELVATVSGSGGNVSGDGTGVVVRVSAGPEHGGVNGKGYTVATDVTS